MKLLPFIEKYHSPRYTPMKRHRRQLRRSPGGVVAYCRVHIPYRKTLAMSSVHEHSRRGSKVILMHKCPTLQAPRRPFPDRCLLTKLVNSRNPTAPPLPLSISPQYILTAFRDVRKAVPTLPRALSHHQASELSPIKDPFPTPIPASPGSLLLALALLGAWAHVFIVKLLTPRSLAVCEGEGNKLRVFHIPSECLICALPPRSRPARRRDRT